MTLKRKRVIRARQRVRGSMRARLVAMAEVMAAACVAVAGATAAVTCRARPRMIVYFYGRAAAEAIFSGRSDF